jgi:ubiquinone/menaquinone biosynthesis C-methylase UbiE
VTEVARDRWAEWLLERRFGGDQEQHERALEQVGRFRQRVLDNAALEGDEALLDVGAGDGLIAFGALDRLGPEGTVILSDISDDLLEHARVLAEELGVADRCSFVRASADDLAVVDDGSVDVVTTRSVLIYLDRDGKRRAFEEFRRVLRPGGRVSSFEPINAFGCPEPEGWFYGYDLSEIRELVGKVLVVASPEGESTLVDFDERDLLAWAEAAGFDPIRLEYEAELGRGSWLTGSWEAALHTSPNPLAPTLDEALDRALTTEERVEFETRLRPLVEANAGRRRMAYAYLSATKP